MRLNRHLILACLASLVMTGGLFAAEPEAPATEAKKANITMDEARVIALEKVPGGEMTSEELSREAGKLTYVFEVRTEGKKGLDVVSVLASDGTVTGVTHKSEWAARRDAQTKRRNEAKNRP
ncbi:MAG TPA: hypothetical protein VN493_19980 [Thermoanaerobaculia bacterium]|nr:hypothetical protein [Thermoanaerobaculia bacterium]